MALQDVPRPFHNSGQIVQTFWRMKIGLLVDGFWTQSHISRPVRMIFARANLKMKTPAFLRSVRLWPNIHVSALTPEELHHPGGQQTSVVRNALIILVEKIGLFHLQLVLCFDSLLIEVVCLVFPCSCEVPIQYGTFWKRLPLYGHMLTQRHKRIVWGTQHWWMLLPARSVPLFII